jgi:hypothetical protein
LDCLILGSPPPFPHLETATIGDHLDVHWLWAIPCAQSEIDTLDRASADSLLKRLDEHGFGYWDLKRPLVP